MTVWRHDLTKTENILYQTLLAAAGKVVSQDELLLAIGWPPAYDRLIRKHISNLRKKLGRDAIETVKPIHGLSGYRWRQ